MAYDNQTADPNIYQKERGYQQDAIARNYPLNGNAKFASVAEDPSPFARIAMAQKMAGEAMNAVRDLANTLCGSVPEEGTDPTAPKRLSSNAIFDLTTDSAEIIQENAKSILADVQRIRRRLPG